MMLEAAPIPNRSSLDGPLASFVAARAGDWFASARSGGQPTAVRVVSQHRRRVCSLYRLEATVDGQRYPLFAKRYRPWRSSESEPVRLFPRPATDDKAPFEYAALRTIHDYFARLSNPRFSAVRPLAVLPAERTVVMERFAGLNLAWLLVKCHPLTGVRPRLELAKAFGHTGAWLREYHGLPPLDHTRVRGRSRHDFIASVQRATAYLAAELGTAELFEAVSEQVAAVATAALSCELPLRLSHTDFGPRNVLVGADQRVCVIDTLARWQAPLYEDIGHFLAAMHMTGVQMYSRGWWLSRTQLAKLEQAFLKGYFGNSFLPSRAVRLFEIQSVLYEWAAISHAARRSVGVRRLAHRCRLSATNRFLAEYLQRLIGELAQ